MLASARGQMSKRNVRITDYQSAGLSALDKFVLDRCIFLGGFLKCLRVQYRRDGGLLALEQFLDGEYFKPGHLEVDERRVEHAGTRGLRLHGSGRLGEPSPDRGVREFLALDR